MSQGLLFQLLNEFFNDLTIFERNFYDIFQHIPHKQIEESYEDKKVYRNCLH